MPQVLYLFPAGDKFPNVLAVFVLSFCFEHSAKRRAKRQNYLTESPKCSIVIFGLLFHLCAKYCPG